REAIADEIALAARPLRLQLIRECRHDGRDALRGQLGCRRAVPVLLAEEDPEAALWVIGGQGLERTIYHQQALDPDEPVLAEELVGETEHPSAVVDLRRYQRRIRCQALGEVQLIDPARARSLVVPGDDRGAR